MSELKQQTNSTAAELKRIVESGLAIDEQVFRRLSLSAAVEVQERMGSLEEKVERRVASFETAVKKRLDDVEAKIRTDWKPVIIALVIAILTVAASWARP